MGSVNRNDKGKWVVRWRDLDGRQRERTYPRKRDADAWNAEVESEKTRGVLLDPRAGQVTFGEYAREWIESRPGAPTTRDTYDRHYRNHMEPTFGRRRLNSIKPGQVQGWVTALVRQHGLAPSTTSTVYKVFASILRAAQRDGHIASSPCEGVRLPEVTKTTVRVLTNEQILTLADEVPERYRALVIVAGGAGLRQGEAFGLCADSVRFLERRLTVDRQVSMVEDSPRPTLTTRLKTRTSRRSVPLADSVSESLARHIELFGVHPESGALFTAPRGGYLKRGTFNEDVWKPAIARAGLPMDTTFHDLRHSYASLLIMGGVNIKEVSTWMGHSTITETADTYAHLLPEADDRARAAIELAFAARRANACFDAEAGVISGAGRTIGARLMS